MDALVTVKTEQQTKDLVAWARERRQPIMILGAGSNLLVRDGGVRGLVVKLANEFEAEISVSKNDAAVDGKSVAAMLTLYAPCGTDLRIRARGADAAKAVRQLAGLVASGFPNALGDQASDSGG